MNNKQKLTNLMEYTIVPAILEDLDIDIDDTEAVIQAFKTLQGLIDNEIEAIKKVDLLG